MSPTEPAPEGKIRAIVFDIGQVILQVDFSKAVQTFAAARAMEPLAVIDAISRSPELESYDRGRMSCDDFYAALRSRFDLKLPDPELRSLWTEIFEENRPAVEFVRAMKAKSDRRGLPMYLLSNTCRSHVERFEADYDVFTLFDDRIYSCDVGLMKPQKEIFELAVKKFRLTPWQSLFIDDRLENVSAARELGFQTIHCTSNEALFDGLRRWDLADEHGLPVE
ncbi:MAG: HAD family phosphatase [Verrucomicrobiae bacterium]|nr:HAD family phosphatase [Verrucomicrobiae bacterium]